MARRTRRVLLEYLHYDAQEERYGAQTQHLNHEPQTAWNTLLINEL